MRTSRRSEAMRRDIEDSRGEKDRAYIQRAIAFQ
jgi:hypothetical protein